MQKEYVTCPITNFHIIKEILFLLESEHDLQLKTLAEFTKKTVAAITNALPIMRELGLVLTTPSRPKKISLTKDGEKLAYYLKSKDKEKIKELAQNRLLPKSKILSESLKILSDNPEISSEKLGRILNEKLESNEWKHNITYRNVGRTCMYLLDAFQLVPYKGHPSRGSLNGRKRKKLLPLIPAEKIFDLLEKFKEDHIWIVTNSDQRLKERERAIEYRNTLLDLGIAQFIDRKNNVIHLTNEGLNLKYTKDEKKRKEIFKNILLKNHHLVEIIKMIRKLNKEISNWYLGEILEKYNDTIWSDSTKRNYGMKLLNWLKEANILEENIKWGTYRFSNSFLEENPEITQDLIYYDKKTNEILIPDSENKKIALNSADQLKHTSLDQNMTTKLNNTQILNNLNRSYWLRFIGNKDWYFDETLKHIFYKSLSTLLNNSSGISKNRFQIAKFLLDKAYENPDEECIKNFIRIINIELYEDRVIST